MDNLLRLYFADPARADEILGATSQAPHLDGPKADNDLDQWKDAMFKNPVVFPRLYAA